MNIDKSDLNKTIFIIVFGPNLELKWIPKTFLKIIWPNVKVVFHTWRLMMIRQKLLELAEQRITDEDPPP